MVSRSWHRSRASSYCVLAATLMGLARTSGAQTWTGTLDGTKVNPPNLSQATGSVTLTLSGTTLVVLMSWIDLDRLPGGVDIHAGVPRESHRNLAVIVPDYPVKRSGSFAVRIDLTLASAYDAGFLRQHGGQVDAARAAFVAALTAGEGYIDVRSPNVSLPPEIGARLVWRSPRE